MGNPQKKFEDLLKEYKGMSQPVAEIKLGGKELDLSKEDMVIGEAHVELTSGYEASVASFRLYDVMNDDGTFKYKKIEKELALGAVVTIGLGYDGESKDVFQGYVTGLSFAYDAGDLPCIEVSAMDIKGLMMGGCYSEHLDALYYSDAVIEVLKRMEVQGEKLNVSDTPDKKEAKNTKTGPISMELVAESDYEFVVRAAKRYNYEFFVQCGTVQFRPAKENAPLLLAMSTTEGISHFRISYGIAGVVKGIEARAMDPDSGKIIKGTAKLEAEGIDGSAKALLGKGKKVVLDPSIHSQTDADARVAALTETMSYRLGSIQADCVGLPDLAPGCFIKVTGMGDPVNNEFYLTKVVHDISGEKGYATHIEGCVNKMGAAKNEPVGGENA